MGIGIVLGIAAGGTIVALMFSQSSNISIAKNIASGGMTDLYAAASSQLTTTSGSDSTKKPDRNLVLIADEFGWNGTENGPVIRVTKDETIQLTVINAGKMAHNFGIAFLPPDTKRLVDGLDGIPLPDRLGRISYNQISAMPCPECKEMFEQGHIMKFILPGQQATVTFTADQAGEFKYFCMVRGHLWLGMNSDFIVESEKGIAGPTPEHVNRSDSR